MNNSKKLNKKEQEKHYLIRLLLDYRGTVKLYKLAEQLQTHRTNVYKYLNGTISISNELLGRVGIKPKKEVLQAEIQDLIMDCHNMDKLISIYNALTINAKI